MSEKAPAKHGKATSVFEIPAAVLKNADAAYSRLTAMHQEKPNQLTPKEADFIAMLIEMAAARSPDNKTVSFTYKEYQDFLQRKNALTNVKSEKRSTHRTTLNRRMNTLTELGLFASIDMDAVSGGKAPKLYRLQPVHETDFNTKEYALLQQTHGRGVQRLTNISSTLKDLKKSDAQLVKEISQARSRSDGLFTGVLDRAMRFSTREVVDNNEIVVKMRIKRAHLTIMATAHHQLAALSDQRVIRACVTCIAHIIDTKLEDYQNRREVEIMRRAGQAPRVTYDQSGGVYTPLPSEWSKSDMDSQALSLQNKQIAINEFLIDSVDIAKLLHYKSPHSSATRKLINESLRRLADTNFRLYISNPESPEAKDVMNLFGLDDTAMDFRFIQDLKSQHYLSASEAPSTPGKSIGPVSDNDADPFRDEELRRVRLWKISIDSHLYDRLLDKNTRKLYLAHPEIMLEKSGLAQSIYNLMNGIIGRKNPSLTKQQEKFYCKSLETLHNTLWPLRRYDRFQEDVIDILRHHAKRKDIPFAISGKGNRIPIFGFIFRLFEGSDGKLWIKVTRDPNDPLTGNNSYHNMKVARDLFS